MNLRERAKRLLQRKGVRGGHLVTSKFYRVEESWTKEQAWWVQIPWSVVHAGKVVHVVLEAQPGSQAVRYLRVPAAYFLSHERGLAVQSPDKISLFLCAEAGHEFEDHRGSGQVSFAQFEDDAGAA
jgi:hypothetical protein